MKDNQKAQEVMNTSFTMVCGSGIISDDSWYAFCKTSAGIFGASEDALVYAYLHDNLPDRNGSIHDRHRNEPFINAEDTRQLVCFL